jgi:hypothetical protein
MESFKEGKNEHKVLHVKSVKRKVRKYFETLDNQVSAEYYTIGLGFHGTAPSQGVRNEASIFLSEHEGREAFAFCLQDNSIEYQFHLS